MHAQAISLFGLLAAGVTAVPHFHKTHSYRFLQARESDTSPACLPQNDHDQSGRRAAVEIRNQGYVYGPSLIGDAAPFPNGTLGNARAQADMDLWTLDRAEIDNRTAVDIETVKAAIAKNGGLNTLDDYAKVLYDGQWLKTNPRGTAPGIMTNYTQDLLFSMERLSSNPYSLRIIATDEHLPFTVDDGDATKIAGATLAELQASNSLFFVDYTSQAHYPGAVVDPPRWAAACSAYFYIHPDSKDFLPLAIKTNTGADLIYTPLDSPSDWLLGKMIFSVNDQFHAQMNHLVISHDVTEAVHQAALHTLSEKHPIMIILERIMYEAYSSRIVGEELCFNPGGHWDQLLYINNIGCRQFVTETWPTGGKFQANYLQPELQSRGLVDASGHFPFKSFPFFEDASRIESAYRKFFTSFIDAYYSSDADVAADCEVQDWFVEATAHASVQDFPSGTVDKATLVQVLTHFGFLASVAHHSLNGGEPISSKGTLPFHLPALHAPLPTSKGVTDLVPFLPPVANAVHYLGFEASFNRPFYADSGRNLEQAMADSSLLARLNDATNKAAKDFAGDMHALSTEIQARGFDENGLSQGMPFVYFALDPGYIPFFCAV